MCSSDPPDNKPHSLKDHQWGIDTDHGHEHGEGADHDHDHDHLDGPPTEGDRTLWAQDNVILRSVGIDIGSAGTQLVFSRLHLQRISEELSTRYVTIDREQLYQSPIALTPYQSEALIDAAALGGIIERAYAACGLHPDDIDTGAVILTGEALRRENGEAIAAVLAEQGGEFVCATAGHHMEAMLAAYGSGAARRSYDESKRILNIDIGGGTTKLSLVDNGELRATAAVHLGGRLLVVDDSGRITRLDPAGRAHALRAGFDWEVGSVVKRQQLATVAASMADALVRILLQRFSDVDLRELFLTDPIEGLGQLGDVMFSGGVGEYVYRREPRDFGDLGKLFGEAVRARIDEGMLPCRLLPAGECIRATVLGASEYSVQLSGNTTFISEPRLLLPRKNLQVVPLGADLNGEIDAGVVAAALRRSFLQHDLVEGAQDCAVSLRWGGAPAFTRLAALARGLLDALPRTLESARPIYIVADGDIAQTLGHLIRDDARVKGAPRQRQAAAAPRGGLSSPAEPDLPRSEVLVIDGITLWGFDFIDLGRIRMPSLAVPVSVKSLVFSDDPRSHGKSDEEHWHHHGDGVMHSHDHHHPHGGHHER